ncbi:MAG: pseudouridylate synthase [Pseudomonadota bacterium]|jgi:23S rRNA pseudouridine1911/1915/1917 synthase
MKIELQVPETARGTRLDKYLGTVEQVQSRSRAIQLIDSGSVLVNQMQVKPSFVLKGGESLLIEIPEATPLTLQPLDIELEILFEDEHIMVINKPPGLVVHPAAGHAQDTLVNALVAHSDDFAMKFGEHRPGIVHRLDKDTSGIMVVAKNDSSQVALAAQFKDRTIHRRYLAIACGSIKQEGGTIKSFLARHPTDRKRFASIRDRDRKIIQDPNLNPGVGKWAHTDYQVIGRHPSGLTYVKLKLHTGRTHQIRVHLSELGHPILGDETYGASKKYRAVPRFALHAAELGFVHPVTKESLLFEKEWPLDYKDLVKELFGM